MDQKNEPLSHHQQSEEGVVKRPVRQNKKPAGPKSNQVAARIAAFVTVFCLLAALAMVHNGSLFGKDGGSWFSTDKSVSAEQHDSVSAIRHEGGQLIINTTDLGKDISGYGGPVPLQIYVTDDKIDSIVALSNSESPKFFGRLESSGLTRAWNGKTLKEAETMEVDAVTGATYSSNAFIANVRAGAAFAEGAKTTGTVHVSLSAIAALLVILAGAILPLFIKKPLYRLIQQLLNVAVLGFWAGTFIDYAMMLNFFSGAPHMTLSFFITLLLLITGLVYPLFNKPNFYCTWICPFGSLQELAGKVCKKKWKISPILVKALDTFRQLLWVVLLTLLFAGWGTSWIDYEIFTSFIVESASWIIIAVGGLFVVLSLFISRPFCRFVCPTGSLLKQA